MSRTLLLVLATTALPSCTPASAQEILADARAAKREVETRTSPSQLSRARRAAILFERACALEAAEGCREAAAFWRYGVAVEVVDNLGAGRIDMEATPADEQRARWLFAKLVRLERARAEREGTMEAYLAYAREFSGTPFAEEAIARADALQIAATVARVRAGADPMVLLDLADPSERSSVRPAAWVLVAQEVAAIGVEGRSIAYLRRLSRLLGAVEGAEEVVARARAEEETAAWRAVETDAVRGAAAQRYRAFRKEYPDGAHQKLALERETKAALADAIAAGGLQRLQAFQREYAGSPLVANARREEEKRAENAALLSVEPDAYFDFLSTYGSSPGAARVRASLARLLDARKKSAGGADYERFLEQFPTAPEAAKIKAALAGINARERAEEARRRAEEARDAATSRPVRIAPRGPSCRAFPGATVCCQTPAGFDCIRAKAIESPDSDARFVATLCDCVIP